MFRTRLQINAGVLRLEFYMPPEAKGMYSRASCCGNRILHVVLKLKWQDKENKLEAKKTPLNLSGKENKNI